MWVFSTAELAPEARRLSLVLSDDEQRRYRSLSLVGGPATWLVAHVGVRLVLGGLLGTGPAGLRFATSGHPGGAADGKPWCLDAPQLDFSISHARSLSCAAVASAGLVGVDVEAIPVSAVPARMVLRSTTPAERAELGRLPPVAQREAFARLWCRKEACAKAVGAGLGVGFDGFSVDESGPHPPDALAFGGRPWSVHDLAVPAGQVAAVAFLPARNRSPRVVHVHNLDACGCGVVLGVGPAPSRRGRC